MPIPAILNSYNLLPALAGFTRDEIAYPVITTTGRTRVHIAYMEPAVFFLIKYLCRGSPFIGLGQAVIHCTCPKLLNTFFYCSPQHKFVTVSKLAEANPPNYYSVLELR